MSRASVAGGSDCESSGIGAALSAGPRNALFVLALQAQNIGMRTVSGTVLDENSSPLPAPPSSSRMRRPRPSAAIIPSADGHFHFAQVDMSIDFDLWAEKDGKKSAIKTVSSWDARKDFISDLKLK